MSKKNNNGSWLIQFEKGTGAQPFTVKVFHEHDDRLLSSTYCNMNKDSSSLVICDYVCKSCKKRTSLKAEYMNPAGKILSST